MIPLYETNPALLSCKESIEALKGAMIDCFSRGGKLLLCGNGGSCADCEHIVGELMKGFLLPRRMNTLAEKLRAVDPACADPLAASLQGALPAISLPHQAGILSAFANDVSPETVYAQLVLGYAKEEDLLLCLSTSGNSENAVNAAKVARALGIATAALTGERESKLSALCDITVRAPARETYRVQELHLPIYHYLCAAVEEHFFSDGSDGFLSVRI